jgi:hypothetical protein
MLSKPPGLLLSDAARNGAEGDLAIEAIRRELKLPIGVVGGVRGDGRGRRWNIDRRGGRRNLSG